MKRLNIGRGGHLGGDWSSVDIDPGLKPDIIDDVRTLESIEDETVDEIFASHVLEHIDEKDVLPTLRIWCGKLKPGGKLSIFVPDVEQAWKDYFNNKMDEKTLLITMIGQEPSRSPYQLHRTMFWYSRLEGLLTLIGFDKCWQLPARGKRFEFGIQVKK